MNPLDWFRGTKWAEPAVPEPLMGRHQRVGGIEAVILDRAVLFFGFDHRDDVVLSPPIADAGVMARFASRHMQQTDGAHDEAWWLDDTYDARAASQLVSEDQERTFATARLRAARARLEAAAGDRAVPGTDIPYHLLFLLAAAGGWEAGGSDDVHDIAALRDDLACLASEDDLAPGECAAAARRVLAGLDALLAAAPAEWASRFAMLRPGP